MHENQINNQDVASLLVQELLKERRKERRWKNIRFFLVFMFIVFIGFLIWGGKNQKEGMGLGKEYVSLVRLDGMIGPDQDFSAEVVLPVLEDAFSDTSSKGVILDINSGGGTPVQASIIHDGILRLKQKYHKKVVVVGEDMLASGAYFVAVSADKIYVNPNTITGSIGVIMKGFGFPELIKKVGVERRVYTSGNNKDRLDPFLPQSKEDIDKIRQVMSEVHDNFDAVVIAGRKGKLVGDTNELFSGDFWSGQTALKLGLVDNLGNLYDAMQSEFHVTHYKDYSNGNGFLKALLSQMSMSLNQALADDDVKVLEKL